MLTYIIENWDTGEFFAEVRVRRDEYKTVLNRIARRLGMKCDSEWVSNGMISKWNDFLVKDGIRYRVYMLASL
jgi:hypothetical protein